ncbi:MAG TPA: PIN domain-containing protein [Lacipirellulaceae bacterium]|mgnify:CR=1 FL=1|nr:PIN domain-containing protein [Lacipirellulaceae bacterium]HMP08018.1 PIN domain-containing protein [Lacipirellulaceae bacterium]
MLRSVREPLVTTDYTVDETLTLLRARNEHLRAVAFGRHVIDGGGALIVHIDDQDFAQAWKTFQQFHDKQWSFTDCVSRVVIERLGIPREFAFDEHFRQFGNVAVVP